MTVRDFSNFISSLDKTGDSQWSGICIFGTKPEPQTLQGGGTAPPGLLSCGCMASHTHSVVAMQTIPGQPSEKMYLQELSARRPVMWLTRHAGKCCCQWRSLPDPEVFVTHSRPKPSGKLNGCFCEMVKLFHDSSRTNKKHGKVKLHLPVSEMCFYAIWKLAKKKSVCASVCSVLFGFSDWLCSVKKLMTHSFEIYETSLHFICELTWFLT